MLNKQTIKMGFVGAFTAVMNQTDPEKRQEAIELLCDKMADTVIAAIKSATITYIDGLKAPNGPVTGKFEHEIS